VTASKRAGADRLDILDHGLDGALHNESIGSLDLTAGTFIHFDGLRLANLERGR